MTFGKTIRLVSLAALTIASVVALSPAAFAQDASEMSCNELWYKRNEIYARAGFCFKTQRAIAQFGTGCFPPYGELHGWQRSRVNELQAWESRRGC